MSEQIFTNRIVQNGNPCPMLVAIELLDEVGLDDAVAIFEAIGKKPFSCTQTTVTFKVMYAVELADILTNLEQYRFYPKLINTGNALHLSIEAD